MQKGRIGLSAAALVALVACGDAPRKATSEDTAAVRVTCAKHADYDPGKGAEVVAQLDARLGGATAPWRDGLEEVCYFSQKAYFVVYTTIDRGDERSRELLCEALRETGTTGSITPIHVHCGDGKRCTTCRQGGGGHR